MQHDDRDKTFRAASELLSENGIAALSLRAVAKRAELSTMAVYTHFGGKSGLLGALYDEGFELLATTQTKALAEAAEEGAHRRLDDRALARLTLRKLCHCYRHVARSKPAHYRLMTGGDVQVPAPSQGRAHQTFTRLRDCAHRWLGLREAPSAEDASHALALALFVFCHGFVALELAGMLPVAADQTQSYFDQLLERQLVSWETEPLSSRPARSPSHRQER